jgi:hypothetical protein
MFKKIVYLDFTINILNYDNKKEIKRTNENPSGELFN